ncbi:MAG: hypothetical protein DBY04_02320 [Clostridiales bacterium]|nr:MAG: hypothetical protein DBY04_02320 [Clostridiales bacterium]
MTDGFSGTDTLRDRLLIAGTKELGQYGMAEFSLRRVAAACGTSCAAPYKHFKNKEAFILEIIRYIDRQWELLRDQILSLYKGDARRQLTEVCVAYIRFWVANPNYRSVFALSEKTNGDGNTDGNTGTSADIRGLVHAFCMCCEGTGSEERKFYKIQSILYGMTAMLESGELSNDTATFSMIRGIIEEEFA